MRIITHIIITIIILKSKKFGIINESLYLSISLSIYYISFIDEGRVVILNA